MGAARKRETKARKDVPRNTRSAQLMRVRTSVGVNWNGLYSFTSRETGLVERDGPGEDSNEPYEFEGLT